MKEILIHISAPTSRKDDERYRRLAEAYDAFEPATVPHCTARTDQFFGVNASDAFAATSPRHVHGTPANPDTLHHRGVAEERPSAHLANDTPRVKETPVASGFVEPAQIIPASRKSSAKGKRLELYAQAPDFGSFMSTSSSRTPIQQLHELEWRFLQQQRSSVERYASGQPKGSTPGKGPHPLFIEDTQEALAVLEDHVDSSSFGSWPSSSPAESPIMQKSSTRSHFSIDPQSPEISRTGQHAEVQAPETPLVPSTWAPPPRTTSMDSMSSQMPEDYSLSNSQSASLRTPENSGPILTGRAGLDGSLDAGSSQQSWQKSSTYKPSSLIGQARPGQTTRETSQRPQSSTQDISELTQMHAPSSDDKRPSQASTQDVSEHVQTDGRSDESHIQMTQDASAVEHTTAVSKQVHQPQGLDFASLPLQLLPKTPSAEKKRRFNEVTSMLELYVEKASIARHYKPASVSRRVGDGERGCWMFDTSSWEVRHQHEFWTRMQYLLGAGYFGDVWLQRNIPKDWRSGGSDGDEGKRLGVVWLFCWGQVVPYMWVVLLVESNREIRKSKARWTVGPMEALEVVVQMP